MKHLMTPRRRLVTLPVAFILMTSALAAAAGPLPPQPDYTASSVIEDRAFEHARGAVAVNQAAGDANAQTNAAAIAIAPNGIATASVQAGQRSAPGQATVPDVAAVRLGNQAFGQAQGLIAINQTSGTGNTQFNGAAIAMGQTPVTYSEVALDDLAGTAAVTELPEGGEGLPARSLSAGVEAGALGHARGVVQLNQSAGVGNATANHFALRVGTGTAP